MDENKDNLPEKKYPQCNEDQNVMGEVYAGPQAQNNTPIGFVYAGPNTQNGGMFGPNMPAGWMVYAGPGIINQVQPAKDEPILEEGKICKNCGKISGANANYCPDCGSDIRNNPVERISRT